MALISSKSCSGLGLLDRLLMLPARLGTLLPSFFQLLCCLGLVCHESLRRWCSDRAGSWSVVYTPATASSPIDAVSVVHPSGVSAIRSPSSRRRERRSCRAAARCPPRPAERSSPPRHRQGSAGRTWCRGVVLP